MAKNRNIRALVLLNPIGFFYDKGHPKGVMYEAMEEFQKFVNQKLKTGKLDVKVTFLPMRVDQIEAALNEGVGDLIAYGIVVTPEREQRVAFSTPIQTDVSQIIVTGKNFGAVSTLADLGGKEVYVNPLTTYYGNLQKVNEDSAKGGQDADRHQGRRQELDGRRPGADGERRINPGDGHDETKSRVMDAGARQAFSRIPTWRSPAGGQLAWVDAQEQPATETVGR